MYHQEELGTVEQHVVALAKRRVASRTARMSSPECCLPGPACPGSPCKSADSSGVAAAAARPKTETERQMPS